MEIGKLSATTLGKTLRFDVRPGSPLSVGRSSRCSVKVRDPKMSRQHCQLELVDGKLRVTDLASSHGLTYRGLKTATFEIEVGDGFHVGQTYIRFEARGIGEDAPAVEVRRTVPVGVATGSYDDQDDDDQGDEDDEYGEYERAGDEQVEQVPQLDPLHSAPVAEYPEVPVGGRPTGRRRPARKRGSFAMQLFGQVCLILTVVITTLAVVLAAKNHNPEWDVYRLLDLLKPPK